MEGGYSMATKLSGAPYYDRYDGNSDHKKKGYTRVLARPGFAEQASEFNEIQSIQRDYVERLGKALLKDGYIVSGCELNIVGRVATINPGKIFLDGLVRDFDGDTLSISGVGEERIVAYVETEIVTENEDSSLRDPAQGSENFGLAGAHREKQTVHVSLVSSDNFSEGKEGAQLYILSDGDILKDSETKSNSYITDTLAERTYDENGNFKISGINLRSLVEMKGSGKDATVEVYITSGKAYVRGYEVSKSSMSSVSLRQATDTRFVQSESHYYSSTISKYELSNGPIASVDNMTCLVAVMREKVSRGGLAGGYDSLKKTPVDSISRVYTIGSGGNILKTYVEGKDYKLYNDQIDWSLSGDDAEEPIKNTTYYVDYIYNKTMDSGIDFDIENTESKAYIVFKEDGSKPNENSRMYISYSYTLARRDLILLDSTGKVSVIEGSPEKLGKLITPFNGSTAYLELGYVDVYPTDKLKGTSSNPNIAKVTNYDGVRLTQDDFNSMLQRIEALETDMAQLDLERSIENSEEANLKGYFTDNFKSIDKSDLTYQTTSGNTEIKYNACIDYTKGELTTAADMSNIELVVDDSSSDSYATYGTIISAPYELELALQQKYATGLMKVNPYASYGPMCQVKLDPEVDNWTNTETIKVYNTIEDTTYDTSTSVYSHGWWSVNAVYNLRGFLRTETTESTTYLGTTVTNSVSSSVAKTLYDYMRNREVKVTGRAFSGGMKNIRAEFNNIPVSLIAITSEDKLPIGVDTLSGTVQGTPVTVGGKEYKTVNASENGSFECYFVVPDNVPCGSVEVKFVGTDSNGDEYTGTAIYTANGTLLTTTITDTTKITERYKVLREVHNLYSSDPLAQTFMMSDRYDRNLMKLGLYFNYDKTMTTRPSRPVIVQIRDVVNGYPGETVYAEVSVPAEEIRLPINDDEPVVTEVVLNQPVYCYAGKYYCFVVLSDSNYWQMYYADMGQTILGRNESLVVNPYATGVMFSSSNASTWTAHQGADLKFELYRSRFTGNGEIVFTEVDANSPELTGLLLDAAYEDNSNSGLQWFYKFTTASNIDSEWLPIDTLVYRDLQSEAKKVTLKAVITTDFSTSPYIDVGRVSLRSFLDDNKATYISKHLTPDDFDEEYQSLKISYQAALPSGSSHTIYYQDVDGGPWVEVEADSSDIDVNDRIVTLETRTVDEEFVQWNWNIKKLHCMTSGGGSKTGSRYFKIRIDLRTNIRYNRPRIRRLSTIFKYNY